MTIALGPVNYGNLTFAEAADDPASAWDAINAADARSIRAADNLQTYVENFNARERALEWAYERRNRQIEAVTGKKLLNPMLFHTDPIFGRVGRGNARAEWEAEVARLAADHPDQAQIFRTDTVPGEAAAFAGLIGAEAEAASEAGARAGANPMAAGLAGGVVGFLRDPMQAAASVIGGGPSAAKTVLARVGTVVTREAVINAGLESAIQLRADQWRRETGQPAGLGVSAERVGMAALFGAAIGGVAAFVHELARVFRLSPEDQARAQRIHAGNPEPGDVEGLAAALNRPLTREEAGTVRAAEADAPDRAASVGETPGGLTPDEARIAETQALRHAEAPLFEPPPDIVPLKPPRTADVAEVLDDGAAGRAMMLSFPPSRASPSASLTRGRPVTFASFDAATLGTDARTFQYKSNGDAAGVTERLKDVKRWDPTASGKAFLFERADGSRVVADGHQRLGLARRLIDEGRAARIDLEGYLFREADGWTPADVRALAAKKNLQEGSGSTLDAARMLRDRPDILDESLPVTGPMMRNAVALSRLSDEAWGMTVNGLVPESQAAIVGAMVPDRALHGAVMSDLHRFGPETDREARLLVAQSMRASRATEETLDLFGRSEATRTLMGERVKVLDTALQTLRSDRKIFSALAQHADVIEEAGNILARAGNEQRKLDADLVAEIVEKLALRVGRVSDFLNRAAEALASGGTRKEAARNFLDDVKRVIDEEGLVGLHARAQLAPSSTTPEPGTAEAMAAAERAAGDVVSEAAGEVPPPEPPTAVRPPLKGEVGGGEASLFDLLPAGRDAEGKMIFADRDSLLEEAARGEDLADLVASCKS